MNPHANEPEGKVAETVITTELGRTVGNGKKPLHNTMIYSYSSNVQNKKAMLPDIWKVLHSLCCVMLSLLFR